MSSIVKGLLFIVFGLLMLAWFAYGIMSPPARLSETYSMDWVMIFVRLIGALSLLVGGVIQLFQRRPRQ